MTAHATPKMTKTKRHTGFTLIEMAVVLIIMGIISAVMVPTMMESFKKEKRSAGRAGLLEFRDRIVGYAVSRGENGYLPDTIADVGASQDVWGSTFRYYRDATLAGSLNAGVICTASTTGTTVTDTLETGNSATNVAFIVTSDGHDKTADIVLQAATDTTNKDDDLVASFTLFELKSLMCKSDASAGDASTPDTGDDTPTPTGGASSADEYVIYSAGGNLSVPNGGDVQGDIAADGDVTLQNNADVNGDVSSTGDVTMVSNSDVDGSIYSNGDVTLQNNTEVTGDVHAVGNVTINSGWGHIAVSGNIYSNGTVYLASSSHVAGNIYALGGVVLGWNAQVDGDIVSGGDVELQGQSEVGGSVYADGDIDFSGGQADVYGDAEATGSIDLGGYWDFNEIHGSQSQGVAASSLPTLIEPTVFDPPSAPTETDFAAGGPNQSSSWNHDLTLAPGTYGSLSFGGHGDLRLSSGNYYFDSITTGSQTNLYLDVSGGPINIFVLGNVSPGDSFDVLVSSNGSSYTDIDNLTSGSSLTAKAADVYTESHGNWTFHNSSDWFGTIYVSGNLTFDNQNDLIGSYYAGGTSDMANQIDMIYVASTYAAEHW